MTSFSFIGQSRIPVWVFTSSPEQYCRQIYRRIAGLELLGHHTVWREQYINGKPNPEGLNLALRGMGVPADEAAFVGDAQSDYGAAFNAGCRFVYFLRNPANNDPQIPEGIPRIARHDELLSLDLGVIRGLVYDLDGTIVDATVLHANGWRAAAERHGIRITDEFLVHQMGRTNEEAAAWLLGDRYAAIGSDFVSTKKDYVTANADEAEYFEDFAPVYAALALRS